MRRFNSAYILAGGQSSRFGENKALVSVFGEPLIVRLASQLVSDSMNVTLVVQNVEDYSAYGIPSIEDGLENSGPLAGVLAALRNSEGLGDEWCVITSCDILNWRTEWISALNSALNSTPDAEAVVFSGEKPESFQPFPGLYRTEILELGKELWNDGVRSMRKFHSRIGKKVVRCPLERILHPKTFNTQEELKELLAEKDLN